MVIYQRTGLTEGSLLYNNWLKGKGLYRKDTEDEFINWLYSTSGWYDKSISGSYFDIDCDQVRESPVYNRFLTEFEKTLFGCEFVHVMLHSDYHLNGLELLPEYLAYLGYTPDQNYSFWTDTDFIKSQPDPFIVNSFAPLITKKYGIPGLQTPFTFFNEGPHQNSFETLKSIVDKIPLTYETYLVSVGPYGCFIVDYLRGQDKNALTIGSGLHDAYPVKITEEFKPPSYKLIEDGRYWKYGNT
jgi:hypothetical protein